MMDVMSNLAEPPPNPPIEPAGAGEILQADPPIELAEAARILETLGFIDHANLPHGSAFAYLLVGLRPAPTLKHFDPEVIRHWVTRAGRGEPREISFNAPLRPRSDVSWGRIDIVDRLHLTNSYVTFGGGVWQDRLGERLVCRFGSPAPILRCGGHSQVFDLGGADVAAHFARLMIAIDYLPGFEQRLSEATPIARYAAFMQDFLARSKASGPLREDDDALAEVLLRDRNWLVATHPDDLAAGADLLRIAQAQTSTSGADV